MLHGEGLEAPTDVTGDGDENRDDAPVVKVSVDNTARNDKHVGQVKSSQVKPQKMNGKNG